MVRSRITYEIVPYSHSCRFLGAKLLLKSYGLGITINKRNNLTRGKCCLHLQIQLSRLDPLIAGCDILELGIRTGKEAVIYTARADQSKTTVRAQLFVHHSYSSLLHHSSRLHQSPAAILFSCQNFPKPIAHHTTHLPTPIYRFVRLQRCGNSTHTYKSVLRLKW